MNELHSFRIIGGLVTFVGKEIDNHVNEATWIESNGLKNYFKILRVDGFITNNYHANSYEEAIQWRHEQAKRLNASRKRVIRKHLAIKHSKTNVLRF
jgi:hypothetical protein